MGGGASFSVGGPGKGMYSRLYTRIVHTNYFVQSVHCFHMGYLDVGLFGFFIKSDVEKLRDLVMMLLKQIAYMELDMNDQEEIERAKNLLKSRVLMSLEAREIWCDDLGRGVLTFGSPFPSSLMMEKVDSITGEDLKRTAAKILKSMPVSFAYAPDSVLKTLPSNSSISETISKLSRKSHIFDWLQKDK